MVDDADARIYAIARGQYGVVGQDQALGAGLTARQLRHRVEVGRLDRLSRKVLGVPGAPESFEREVMAASLHQGRGVASLTAAAGLHGFRYVTTVEVEVTGRYPDHSRNPFGRVHRSVDLQEPDIVMVGPIPTTSPARTAADLLTCLSRARAERQIDDLLLAGAFDLDDLAAVHARYARQGRPTTVALRDILEARDNRYAPPQLELEHRTLDLLRSAGFGEPERQIPLPGWVDHPARADFAYPVARVIIEVDGRRFHGHREQFELDRRRDNAAQLAGWMVLRFTWLQVTRQPEYVLATIAAALRRAA